MRRAFESFLTLTLAIVGLSCQAQEPGFDPDANKGQADTMMTSLTMKLCGQGMPMLESRGIWLSWHDYSGPEDKTLALLDKFKELKLNTVYVCTNMRGYNVYPDSKFLPQWPDIKTSQTDVLKWLVPAIKSRGLRCEAWPEYGFYSYWTPDKESKDMGPTLTKHPDWVAIDKDGNPAHIDKKFGKYYALCAANPQTHKFLIDSFMEQMQRYPFDGLHVDRIRWTNEKFCYCDYCKTAFKKKYGYELTPQLKSEKELADRNEFRCAATASFIKELRKELKRQFPDKTLTAAVAPPEMIEEKGQNWFTWVSDGDVDAVVPMLYRPNITPDLNAIRSKLGNDVPMFVGLANAVGQEKLANQIMQLRAASLPGFTLWVSSDLDKISSGIVEMVLWRDAASPIK
ncbi:MAG: family 10 glycosylhydrolase [Candidatus Sumerlaeales bacterium]|nr:family 10 glycosylhydrolase [Candidatus Sumerlaeales bacterium]